MCDATFQKLFVSKLVADSLLERFDTEFPIGKLPAFMFQHVLSKLQLNIECWHSYNDVWNAQPGCNKEIKKSSLAWDF